MKIRETKVWKVNGKQMVVADTIEEAKAAVDEMTRKVTELVGQYISNLLLFYRLLFKRIWA